MKGIVAQTQLQTRTWRREFLSSLLLSLRIAPFLTLLLLAYVAFNIWGLTYEELRQETPAQVEADAIIGSWTINQNDARSVETREIVIDVEPDQIHIIETRDPVTGAVTIQPPKYWITYKPLPTLLCALTAFVFVLVVLTIVICGVKLAIRVLRPLFKEKLPPRGFEVRLKEAPVVGEIDDPCEDES